MKTLRLYKLTPSQRYKVIYETLKKSGKYDFDIPLHISLNESHNIRLAESHAQILLEKLDDEDMKRSKAILDKLGKIAGVAAKNGMESLSTSIEEASKDLNEFLGGGIGAMIKRGISALMKKIGGESAGSNPILKCATMLSALEAGFGKVPDIIKMNLKDYDEKQGKSPIEVAGEDKSGKIEKNMKKLVLQAFTPAGIYSKIKSIIRSKTSIPYIDDANQFVADILSAKPDQLKAVLDVVNADEISEKTADTAKDLVQAGQKGGKGEAQGGVEKTGSPQPVKDTEGLAKVVAAAQSAEKKQDPGEALKAAEENPKKITQQFIDYVAKKSGQEAEVVNKVVSALIKAKKLKTEFKVTEESRVRKTTLLSLRDVQDARMLYLESGCSSRRWIQLLTEGNKPGVIELGQLVVSKLEEIDSAEKLADIIKNDFENLSQKARKDFFANLKGNRKVTEKLKLKPKELEEKVKKALENPKADSKPDESTGEKETEKKELTDDDIKSLVKVIKDQKLDLESLKGKSSAIATIKNQYGMDITDAKKAYEEKVLPALKSGDEKGDNEKKDTATKFLDNDKIQAGISSAKTGEDLINFILKVADSLLGTKSESIRRFNMLPLITEAMSDEEKIKQGKKLKEKTVELLKKIFSNPKEGEKLLSQVPKAGGLQDKVKELLAGDENPLEKNKNDISGAKTIEDLVASLKKMKKDTVIKKLKDGKELTVGNQISHLESIIKDPKSAENLLKAITNSGGLRDKVKEILESSKKEVEGNKHAKTIEAIQDSLKDDERCTPQAIIKILDALPDYLMAESLRKRKLVEQQKRVNLLRQML